MSGWVLLLCAATAGSVISLIGGLYLLYGKWGTQKLQFLSVPFAAGALLAAAFFDLLPEAIEASRTDDYSTTIAFVLLGFLFFFVLERSLDWYHHHHSHDEIEASGSSQTIRGRRNTSLIIIGDTIHNFIDGLAIGAAFLVNPATGIITTLAIAAHEIPQEIGDFGLLLSKGVSKKRVLVINFVTALVTVVGAALVYGAGTYIIVSQDVILAATAGFFIYIAASDIIPTIHAEPKRRAANVQTVVLLLGVAFVAVSIDVVHSFGH